MKKIIANSDKPYYQKNLQFFEDLDKMLDIDCKNVYLIQRNYQLDIGVKYDCKMIDDYHYNLLAIRDNYIPIPIFINIVYGKNYINYDTPKGIKRLCKVYEQLKSMCTVCTQDDYNDLLNISIF